LSFGSRTSLTLLAIWFAPPIVKLVRDSKPKTQNLYSVSPFDIFLSSLQASLADESFRRLTLGKFRGQLGGVEHVYIRSVTLKDGIRLNFVHRYPDHDLTENRLIPDGVAMVRDWLGKACLAATLFTGDQRHQLLFNRHGEPRIITGPAESVDVQEQHDREKTRLIQNEDFFEASWSTRSSG
jgi:hypothetical protein